MARVPARSDCSSLVLCQRCNDGWHALARADMLMRREVTFHASVGMAVASQEHATRQIRFDRALVHRRELRTARVVRRIALFIGRVAIGAVLVSPAIAQQYQADVVDKQAARLSGFTTNWVRNPARYASDKERFNEYFTKAYFPSMTQFGPKDLEELGKKRYDLFNDVLWRSDNESLQDDLTKMAYDYMVKVVRGANYHPAVRYNAILVIGKLDEEYGNERANRPPKPFADANKYLVQVVGAAAERKYVPPHVLVGALIGLERHARFRESLDRQVPAEMSAVVIKLLSNDPPLPDLDRDVSEWIQLTAASVLARLGSPGAKGEVHQALLDLLAGQDERKMTLDSRCHLVALLDLINYDGAAVDGQATADRILQLAVDVGQAEAERATEFEDLHIVGRFRRAPIIRRRRVNFGNEPEKYDRRTLLARLSDLQTGLQAVRSLVPDDSRLVIDTILTAIKTVSDVAKDDSVIDLDVVKKVRETAAAIEQAVNPATAPTAEQPIDEFGG